jgi:hypothetical protein
MNWDYRIIRRDLSSQFPDSAKEDCITFGIHEVYYNKKGKVEGWTIDPKELGGDNVKDLKLGYKLMGTAFKKPVLTEVKNKKGDDILIEWKEKDEQ